MKLFNNAKYHISPSILACDFSSLNNEIEQVGKAGISYIHYDVMDNHFVPQLTFGYKFVKDFNKETKLLADVHLMIDKPEQSIDKYIDAGADILTFHLEATGKKRAGELINKIKSAGVYAGLSVKPGTPIKKITPYLDIIDMVLIMTVEPGFAGQKLIPECLNKITELKELVEKKSYNVIIQSDGGINLENIRTIYERGCNFFVMGSAFFKQNNYRDFKNKIDALLLN